MGNPLYGSNKADAKLDGMVDAQDAIADAAAATAAVGDSDNTEILVDVADLRTKINAIISALESAGVIKS
jgi:acetolactate synthase small subunit